MLQLRTLIKNRKAHATHIVRALKFIYPLCLRFYGLREEFYILIFSAGAFECKVNHIDVRNRSFF